MEADVEREHRPRALGRGAPSSTPPVGADLEHDGTRVSPVGRMDERSSQAWSVIGMWVSTLCPIDGPGDPSDTKK